MMIHYRWAFISILIFSCIGYSEWGDRRRPTNFNQIPIENNKKSITQCLRKVKDLITDSEASNLDQLKTLIERVYGLNKSFIKFRELYYKTHLGEKWRAEFDLTPESVWGKEKYKLKFFKQKDGNGYLESPGPLKESVLDKAALLRFSQDEEVESDERWESFFAPKEPQVKFKAKNFKLYELSVSFSLNKASLLCSIVSEHPYCQCLSTKSEISN